MTRVAMINVAATITWPIGILVFSLSDSRWAGVIASFLIRSLGRLFAWLNERQKRGGA